ncbi:UNVERIFIED_CONTAM: hypothetical protein Sradi_1216900 [Sesamum radiatum]|uniref:Uncharacterized protein n=1 Tax=Sesamum radiatum TaxID=300843 RepID=A0AAW2UM11_SESRA
MDHPQEYCSNSGRKKFNDQSQKKADTRKRAARKQSLVEDVNKRADDFIKNFRKQLKFEREESLKRSRERMAG